MDGLGMLLNTILGGLGLDANIIMHKVNELVDTAKSIDKRINRIEIALGLEPEPLFNNDGELPQVLIEHENERTITESN